VTSAGRVGADELGALVLRTLRAEGVDVSHAGTDRSGRPTGLIVYEPRLGDLTRVTYYRSGSAGSAVAPGDAFVAGYLSARLDGLAVAGRLARGAGVAAFAVASRGDWEGLPTRERTPETPRRPSLRPAPAPAIQPELPVT
jgi:2-dehydro-3-deoxygluconokinase